MTEAQLQDALTAAFNDPDVHALLRDTLFEASGGDLDDDSLPISAASYDEAGILSGNKGLLLSVGDFEFQMPLVRSR